MATESIFHNFAVTDPEAVKKILEALDWFEKQKPEKKQRKSNIVTDPPKIKNLLG